MIFLEQQKPNDGSFHTQKPKSRGLRRLAHGISKEPLFNRDIDLENIITILGPRYVLKDICTDVRSLEPDRIQILNKHLGEDITEGEDAVIWSQEEIIEMESRRFLRGGKSRFSMQKGRPKKIHFARKKQITNRRFRVRSKKGQRIILFASSRSVFTLFKLVKWRKKSHQLPRIINDEIHVKIKPTLGIKSVNFSKLRSLGRLPRMSFSIVNTTERLDHSMPDRTKPTILLQWGRARPSIRDIRVDGLKTENWFIFIVQKVGVRLNSIWSQRLTTMAGLLLMFMIYALIF